MRPLRWLIRLTPIDIVIPFCIAMLIVGLPIAIKTFPKVEFRHFTTPDAVGAFDIARCGPDRNRFAAFVDRIIQQIKECKTQTKYDLVDK